MNERSRTNENTSTRTPAQWILFGFGLWFVFGNFLAGILIWPSTISDPDTMHFTHLLGFIPVMVNGWHLYFHLITGLACLAGSLSRTATKPMALLVAALYFTVGLLGLLTSTSVLGLIMVDTFGNWVHIVEATLLLITSTPLVRNSHWSPKTGAHS